MKDARKLVQGKAKQRNPRLGTSLFELCDDFDFTNDGFVKRPKIFGRNPVFAMVFAPHLLDAITIQKCLSDGETCDESLAARSSHVRSSQ